jgi:hypothetical protein
MAFGYNATVGASNTIVLGNTSVTALNVPGLNLGFTANTITSTNTNGNLSLAPNGTGAIRLVNNTNAVPLQFYNSAGTFYVGFKSGTLAANTTWTLPTTDSTGTQSLVSNGSGVLSWLSNANNEAKFIIQTADASLPNAQILASLDTGLLKNTTTTGVLTIAVAGTDYMSPYLPQGNIWIGNSSNVATPQPTITIDNLPDLTSGNIWRGNSMNRPQDVPDLSNLENRVTDLESEVADLETRVTTLEGEVTAIQTELATITAEIVAIQAELVVIGAEIAALQLQVTGLEAAVAILQGQIITILADIAALQAYVQSITLTTFVVGGPPDPTTGVIVTSRGPTCLLTNIPAGGDVDLGNYRIFDLATFNPTDWYDMEAKQLDAINFLFLWNFFGGGTR